MIQVMIVDDQQLLLDLLEQTLKDVKNIQIVARASNGQEAVKQAGIIHPDVILMDIVMPLGSGIEAVKAIKDQGQDTKILMLTSSRDKEDVLEALQNGADGYILKNSGKDELLIAIQGVYHGMEIIDREVKDIIQKAKAEKESKGSRKSITVNDIAVSLSSRELEIIKMIVEGKNTAQIADSLFISEGRLRVHSKINCIF